MAAAVSAATKAEGSIHCSNSRGSFKMRKGNTAAVLGLREADVGNWMKKTNFKGEREIIRGNLFYTEDSRKVLICNVILRLPRSSSV